MDEMRLAALWHMVGRLMAYQLHGSRRSDGSGLSDDEVERITAGWTMGFSRDQLRPEAGPVMQELVDLCLDELRQLQAAEAIQKAGPLRQ